jgi:hypothetical protein
MKYTIQLLDGRYSYNQLFEYYIGFSNRMSREQGPLYFTLVQKWFTETYGWSAEVKLYADILQWTKFYNSTSVNMYKKFGSHPLLNQNPPTLQDTPSICNSHWSWTNSYDDLRIYVASDKELTFFQLAHPIDL